MKKIIMMVCILSMMACFFLIPASAYTDESNYFYSEKGGWNYTEIPSPYFERTEEFNGYIACNETGTDGFVAIKGGDTFNAYMVDISYSVGTQAEISVRINSWQYNIDKSKFQSGGATNVTLYFWFISSGSQSGFDMQWQWSDAPFDGVWSQTFTSEPIPTQGSSDQWIYLYLPAQSNIDANASISGAWIADTSIEVPTAQQVQVQRIQYALNEGSIPSDKAWWNGSNAGIKAEKAITNAQGGLSYSAIIEGACYVEWKATGGIFSRNIVIIDANAMTFKTYYKDGNGNKIYLDNMNDKGMISVLKTTQIPGNISSIGFELECYKALVCVGDFSANGGYTNEYAIAECGILRVFEASQSSGYEDGYAAGQLQGYNQGYNAGKNEGYGIGFTNGINEGANLWGFVGSIATIPFTIFSSFLNFEIFGVNIAGLVSALITAGLIIFVWKTFVS